MKATLTIDDINAQIAEVLDYKLGNKTTAVLIRLHNGFEVVGTSACVDPANYNHEVGIEYAKKRAIDKIWEVEGYALQKMIYGATKE